jgi:hypothetical protein
MTKTRNLFQDTEADSVALLLSAGEATDEPWWQPEELADIFQHQMDAPLIFDLGKYGNLDQAACSELTGGSPKTSRELLFGGQPPLQLLWLMKDFAKSCDADSGRSLPASIAMVLYYGAIISARAWYSQNISTLTDADLATGISWVVRQPWVDQSTKQFFVKGLRAE